MVRPTRMKAESEAGRYLWPGFGTNFPSTRAVRHPDDINVANISVLPIKDELLALWELVRHGRFIRRHLKPEVKKSFRRKPKAFRFLLIHELMCRAVSEISDT